jgi:LPXTG-site transpeptidase (sortase) family protein
MRAVTDPARPGRHISPIRVVRRPAAAAALIAGLVIAIAGTAGLLLASQTGHAATPVGRPGFVAIPKGQWAAVPSAVSQSVAEPVSLVIPAIDVSTRLIHLGLTSTGALQVPTTTAVAGWYTGSPRPGEPGGAVIAGHVDSVAGPGVFSRLGMLKPGERVYVRRADGTLAVFAITSVRSYPKTGFPTSAVYGPTPDAQLRLITCGGTFDWATHHYLSNTIAYASLMS